MNHNWGTSELKNDQNGLPSTISPSLAFSSSSEFFPPCPNIFSCPTTEDSAGQSFNWRSEDQEGNKEEEIYYSDFSLQTQPKPSSLFQSSSTMFQAQPLKKQDTRKFEYPLSSTQSLFSSEMEAAKPGIQGNSASGSDYMNYTDAAQFSRDHRRSEEGYNWRKYGQKQVKGSENPRSYYKCTNSNCSMKKKVETTLDGEITEIVYRGSHNHPKPQPTRRTSAQSMQACSYSCTNSGVYDQSVVTLGNPQMEIVSMQEDSSVSVGEDLEQISQISYSGGDDDDFGLEGKRKMRQNEDDSYLTSGDRTVREPRVVVQTRTEIDILDDGYRWRKYGQKVVKGNPNPRSYYKCTAQGCTVRKHVERAAHDKNAVITTYEGKHNHDVPPARGSSAGYNINRTSLNSNTGIATAPIRPSVMTNYSSSPSTFTNSLYNARPPAPLTYQSQEPFPPEILQSPASFGHSAFGRSNGSFTNQAQKDDSFLQSFLSKNH